MNSSEENIPTTGRIGRFAKILKHEVPKEQFIKLIKNSDKYRSFSPSNKAAWWKTTIIRMENELGPEKTTEIMTKCGSKCCGVGHRKTGKKTFSESSSIEDFLQRISTQGVTYQLIDDNTIFAEYPRCFCGQVKATKAPFPNLTYCQCSAAFNRQYFSSVFNKPVTVEVIKSVITGDDSCQFEIHF
jgi:hypothetical protein